MNLRADLASFRHAKIKIRKQSREYGLYFRTKLTPPTGQPMRTARTRNQRIKRRIRTNTDLTKRVRNVRHSRTRILKFGKKSAYRIRTLKFLSKGTSPTGRPIPKSYDTDDEYRLGQTRALSSKFKYEKKNREYERRHVHTKRTNERYGPDDRCGRATPNLTIAMTNE